MAYHGGVAGILRDADDAYLGRSLAWGTARYVTLNVVLLCVLICIVLLTQWVLLFVFLEQQQQQQHNQKPSATSPFNPFPKNKNSFQMHDSCE